MEEIKNDEKNEGHVGKHGHNCHGIMCKCGPMGHRFIKLVMVIFFVILLLCIGAAMGSRHSYRDYGYRGFDRFGYGGCGMRGDWRNAGDFQDGRQFNMMRGQAVQGGFQVIENGTPVNVPVNNVPVMMQYGTSTPNAPLK